jgi:hypothetical protein
LIELKKCGGFCGQELPVDQFHKDKTKKDERQSVCITCCARRKRATKHGISMEQVLVWEQRTRCAICGKPQEHYAGKGKSACLDHCHTTGKIRGVLCHSCNIILGAAKDNPHILSACIDYLAKHSAF